MLLAVQGVLLQQRAEEQAGLVQEFLNAEGKQAEDGNKEDPALDRFEAEIAKYKAVQDEIQVCFAPGSLLDVCCRCKACFNLQVLLGRCFPVRVMLSCWKPLTMPACLQLLQGLPTSASIGYIKIDAKPIKQALSTWVTKWIYLYTRYLQDKVRLLLCLRAATFHQCQLFSSAASSHGQLQPALLPWNAAA